MRERQSDKRRKTYLYTRGDYLRPDTKAGELHPNVMASLHSFEPVKTNKPLA